MYLFNNTPIQTRFDESDKKIASELNKITDNELLNCDLQKIADRIEQQYNLKKGDPYGKYKNNCRSSD